jgi:uncharacterized protein (DUF2237 family)
LWVQPAAWTVVVSLWQNRATMREGKSVLGRPLATCGNEPRTGFYRDGCCHTGPEDRGKHTVCARVTGEFLEFSRSRGNDLTTPVPEHGFPGLKPGDRWCLCVTRWKEAFEAGVAPLVVMAATHENALQVVSYEDLARHAVDLN